ncbi:hypothetical protein F5141DRAFT_1008425, partial [Pisolithus sp. B1]
DAQPNTVLLMEHEWKVLGQLCTVLKVLKDAMLFFSQGTPSLTMVIPAMDYIDEVFMTGILDQQCLDPAICVALTLGKRTLNKYYLLTDVSKLYQIAMVLHPLHKLEYFTWAKWEVACIDGAHDLIHDTYNLSYASHYIGNDTDLMSDHGASGSEVHLLRSMI